MKSSFHFSLINIHWIIVCLSILVCLEGCVHLGALDESNNFVSHVVYKLKTPRKTVSGSATVTELSKSSIIIDFKDPIGQSLILVLIQSNRLYVVNYRDGCKVEVKRWLSRLKWLTGSQLDYDVIYSALAREDRPLRRISHHYDVPGKMAFIIRQRPESSSYFGELTFTFPDHGIQLMMKWLDPDPVVLLDSALENRVFSIKTCDSVSLGDLLVKL